MNPLLRKAIFLTLLFAGGYLVLRYLLPLLAPFLLGGLLALAAEALVRFLVNRCRLPRGAASAIGVTGAFALLALVLMLVFGFFFRQLRQLSGIAPSLAEGIRSGMGSLTDWLLNLASDAPLSLQPLLTAQVQRFFSDGSALLDRIVGVLLSFASGLLSRVPNGALSLGTGIISSYMISAKLPTIRAFVRRRLPFDKFTPFLRAFSQFRRIIFCWLKAQLKLSGITFLLSAAGFFLLGISPAPLWAALVALVDAFPILGTGTILVPWSVVSFLQGNRFRAFALLGLYVCAALLRSVLEPKLVGKQLGLDPLVTLIAIYIGFRLFGLPGMLLAPMIAVTTVRLAGNLRDSRESESARDPQEPI